MFYIVDTDKAQPNDNAEQDVLGKIVGDHNGYETKAAAEAKRESMFGEHQRRGLGRVELAIYETVPGCNPRRGVIRRSDLVDK